MNRRSFIGSILALGVAPAIVRADSLMALVRPRRFALGAALPARALYMMDCADIVEHTIHKPYWPGAGGSESLLLEWIDSAHKRAITKKPEFSVMTQYSYEAPRIELAALENGETERLVLSRVVPSLETLLADGRPFVGNAQELNGRIIIEHLQLEEYGNRIPTFSYAKSEWVER